GRNRHSGRDAVALFEALDELGQLEDGHLVDGLEQVVLRGNCHVISPFSVSRRPAGRSALGLFGCRRFVGCGGFVGCGRFVGCGGFVGWGGWVGGVGLVGRGGFGWLVCFWR